MATQETPNFDHLHPEVQVHIVKRLANAAELPEVEKAKIRRSIVELTSKTAEEQLATVRRIEALLKGLRDTLTDNPELHARTEAWLDGRLDGPAINPDDTGNDSGSNYQN